MTSQEYLIGYFDGLRQAVVSDHIVTSLAVGSLALARQKGTSSGVAAFFLGYAVVRTISTMTEVIGHGSLAVAHSVATQRNIIRERNIIRDGQDTG